MKKTLIALAVLAASGAAMAQSSVTLYGVADVSVGHSNTGGSFASASGLLNDGNSRIGFKGTEDLGGGLKAKFQIEGAVNLATGATDASGTYQRAAYAALAGGFGELYAGRRLTPAFLGMANYELTGTANYSAVANKFGYGGSLTNVRNSASVGYMTPDMNGFGLNLSIVPGANQPTLGRKIDTNATYNNGPLAIGVTYEKNALATDSGKSVGGSYDFGQFIAAVSYQDPEGVKKGFTVGGTVKLGANKIILDIARDTGSAYKSTDIVLVAQEPLSKRTFLYQVLYRAGQTSATATTVTSFGAGMRHNF